MSFGVESLTSITNADGAADAMVEKNSCQLPHRESSNSSNNSNSGATVSILPSIYNNGNSGRDNISVDTQSSSASI